MGFVYIYLSNESPTQVDVYFDDLTITHTKSKVIQTDDYYPFGLTFNSYQRENSTKNNYLYNGKELQDELDLGWMDYGARMYQPEIGRWGAVDALADKYTSFSSYAYVANNPIVFIDPDGKRIIFINGKIGGGSPEAGAPYWNGRNSRFVNRTSKYYNDYDTYFTAEDYGYFSTAEERRESGRQYAKDNYSSLTKNLKKDEDVFRLVTHSMGGAFAAGIKDYLEKEGWNVDNILNLNTFQAGDIKYEEGDQAFIIDFQNTNDPVTMLDGFDNEEIVGADLVIRKKSGQELSYIHRSPIDNADEFWNNLQKIITEFLNENKKEEENE